MNEEKKNVYGVLFILVAFMLAVSIYQTIGITLGTETPFVTVVSPSMEHEHTGRFGRISTIFEEEEHSFPSLFSTDLGLNIGDVVLVTGADFEKIEAGREDGDVIVFESKDEELNKRMPPMIHRVISRNETSLETMGDANDDQVRYCVSPGGAHRMTQDTCTENERLVKIEQDIREEQLKGRAAIVLPNLGYTKLVPMCVVFDVVLDSQDEDIRYMCDYIF